jgi:hypothetical protein
VIKRQRAEMVRMLAVSRDLVVEVMRAPKAVVRDNKRLLVEISVSGTG